MDVDGGPAAGAAAFDAQGRLRARGVAMGFVSGHWRAVEARRWCTGAGYSSASYHRAHMCTCFFSQCARLSESSVELRPSA